MRTDFDTKDQCYVFDIAQSPASSSSFATSCSNHRVKLYNLEASRLQHVGDLVGHAATITGIAFPYPQESPTHLASSSYDGTVRGWDCRAGSEVERYEAHGHELYSFGASGHLVVAGADGKLLFWDRRTQKPLGCFADTHAKEVTQVLFHPAHPNTLVSGSVDGLIAVYDMAGGLDEDEGFKAALNIETSCARVGFYGAAGEKLWCSSHTETLHLWEWQAACSEDMEGGSGALVDAHDAREQLTVAAASTSGGPAAAAAGFAGGVDYIIGAQWDAGAGRLLAAAGTSGGAAALFPVHEPGSGAGPGAAAGAPLFGPPVAVLPSGPHNQVVRSLLCVADGRGMSILTGGEDSRLCLWQAGAPQQPPPGPAAGDSRAMRRAPKGHGKKTAPY